MSAAGPPWRFRARPALVATLACGVAAALGAQPSSAPPLPVQAVTAGAAAAPAAATPGAAVAALRLAIDSMVSDRAFANAHWGVLIVDPSRGDTLYSRNAGKLFMPASNQKLLTGAVALSRLGAGFRWRTVLAARGAVRGGVLRGDLAVIGEGDPSVSDAMRGDVVAALGALADSLRAHGVRRIAGRLVQAGDAFPGDGYGFGWAHDDFDAPYSAPVDELFVNDGIARLTFTGARRAGRPARLRVRPAPGVVGVVSRVRTAAASEALRARWTGDRYEVTGTVAAGDSVAIELAIRSPGRAWLQVLATALRGRGVRVDGGVAVDTAPRRGRADTLVRWESATLAEVLPHFEKASQNQLGELLLRTLGRVADSAGTPEAGRRVVVAQLAAWGIDSTLAAVRDGSGLSRHDYVAPEAIVRVLDGALRLADGAVFRESLPVAGVDGTLARRMRGTSAQGRVRAKTGLVDKARSLSGYVTTADGSTLVFSILCNNWTAPVGAVERVQDAIAVRLASLTLAGRDAQRR
ncbi:MAG: D-alanyl-D-alanine carboxypeptidase/D-alanyl-D-alanine-endopeptidase [Gemmatimonadetes bacterium]|nr:D-alanyl-D-alanine carboxypeptidase/D-alanyl-D-alanine-endopeptidase [Gemmatimonadota bacterium]